MLPPAGVWSLVWYQGRPSDTAIYSLGPAGILYSFLSYAVFFLNFLQYVIAITFFPDQRKLVLFLAHTSLDSVFSSRGQNNTASTSVVSETQWLYSRSKPTSIVAYDFP